MSARGLNGQKWRPTPMDLIAAMQAGKPELMVAYHYAWDHYDKGAKPTVREVAAVSRLSRRQAHKMVQRVAEDFAAWNGGEPPLRKAKGGRNSKRDETGHERDETGTNAGQEEPINTAQSTVERDEPGTKRATSGTLARAILSSTSTSLQEQEGEQAADASESGKPDDPIRALWDKWEPKRVEVYGGRVGKLTKARRSAMRARIKDHSVEEVATVIAWWLTSSHERATFLRANGCTWDTVLRPTKFPAYLEMAGQAAESRRQRAQPTGSDQTERTALEAIAKMRALYADHGSLPYDKMPPAIVGALREIGGIRYLFGAVNDFQQRDRTNAFVAAYRRHAAGTENG